MHWQTHTVFNQPTPLNNSNLFLSDTALREAVVREGAGWDGDLLASIGQQLGTAESLELGRPPTAIRRSCCAMTPPAPGWTTCASIRTAPADAGAVREPGT